MLQETKTIIGPPFVSHERVTEASAETADPRWRGIYRIGGWAALVMAAVIVAGAATFVAWPPLTEATVTDWFELFQRNWLLGILDMDVLMLAGYVTLIPLVLALYLVLRRTSESVMALAGVLALVGITTYFASSRVFEMLALSHQYAVATTEVQRSALVGAGQSMLTTYLGSFAPPAFIPAWNYQGTAFNVSFLLWSVAGVMISVVMTRSRIFSKAAGYVGIVSFGGALGLFVPVIGVFLSLVGLVAQLIWSIMVARGLFRLGRGATNEERG